MYDINNFPEWLTIVDIEPLTGGAEEEPVDSEDLSTEMLKAEIKKLFNEIENQNGGKKKKSKKTSKKKAGGPLDNYNIAANHIAEYLKLGKGVKERAPVHLIIKRIQKDIDQSLKGEEKYKKINEIFDANPEKYT
jgi:hypothetical protein